MLLVKTLFGAMAGSAAVVLAGLAIGTFMNKTIQQCLSLGQGFSPSFYSQDQGMTSPDRSEKRKRQTYSLLAIAALQPLLLWYLSRV